MYICYEHSMYVSHISVSWVWYIMAVINLPRRFCIWSSSCCTDESTLSSTLENPISPSCHIQSVYTISGMGGLMHRHVFFSSDPLVEVLL